MEQKKLKVAVICYDNPFLPPAEGGKKGMMGRINSLLYLNKYEIDIFLLNKQSEGFAEIPEGISQNVRSIKQYQMRSGVSTIIGKYPICVNKRYVAECADDLSKEVYDVALYEGAQVASYRLENKVNARKHIIYLHDIESEYRAEIARSLNNPIVKFANRLESLKFQAIEKKINQFFDQVWYVSKEECERFSRKYLDSNKGIYIPFPAIHFGSRICGTAEKKRLLYVGDMTIKHNVLSMIWFAEKILPRIRKSNPLAEFVVIGRISDGDKAKLQNLGVDVKGYVDDLEQEYRDSACVVCPVLYGAGVKVKTIDALAQGQIVVTNSKGIEGTELEHGKHLLVSDSEEELATMCTDVLNNREKYKKIAEAGYAFVKKYHTIEHQAVIIDKEINRLMTE